MSTPQTLNITTSAGIVELAHIPGPGSSVLVIPGGHCDAVTPGGQDIYSDLGLDVWTVSRPGYGCTSVGDLPVAQFTPVLVEALRKVDIPALAAVVGISFGAQQAVDLAARQPELCGRLIVHSGAPSSLPYPDSSVRSTLGPAIFHPRVQRGVWTASGLLARTPAGLRALASLLSTKKSTRWFNELSAADKKAAQAVIRGMDSGTGFQNDLDQAKAATSELRAERMARVQIPTLVTASKLDGGVGFEHAVDFAERIPGATLVENNAPWHFFWIGSGRSEVEASVRRFLDTTTAGIQGVFQ